MSEASPEPQGLDPDQTQAMEPAKRGHGHGHGHGRMHGHGGHGHGHGGQPEGNTTAPSGEGGQKGYWLIAAIYLFGLAMGALDMGIVTPARTLIQADLGVDDSFGIWMLTIYTLFYATSIPIMGKLADILGRKPIYLICILLFGGGSLLCGLSQLTGNFWMLLGARVIQSLGAGGIMPIATAEIGTSFPEEKRGMALGLVGAVYGVSSVFGASAGSLILGIFGQHNWMFIFLINVPICIFVLILGILKLPNHRPEENKPLDIAGVLVMTIMILSLMYFLKSVDFFNFATSIQDPGVYPFLIVFLVLLPVFILIEKRAADPVINLNYFKNRDIVITMICSIISGLIMMGTVFLPQFCENCLYMESGTGGYFIIILGLFTGFGAPITGKLIDKCGVKPILIAGFIMSVAGALFTSLYVCQHPSLFGVIVSLALLGLGMGFTMGTPLNYMMLQKTDDEESNSAMAMLSLVRSMGTAVAPAIMVAFIVHASAGLQDDLMNIMPKSVSITPLPYSQELDQKMIEMRENEDTADMVKDLDIPKLSSYTTMDVDMDSTDSDFNVTISDDIIQEFQDGDVTTVVESTKHMATSIFAQVMPKLITDAQGGIQSGITTMENKLTEMDDALAEMKDGENELSSGISEMSSGLSEMRGQIGEMADGISQMNDQVDQMNEGLDGIKQGITGIKSGIKNMESALAKKQAELAKLTPGSEEYAALAQEVGAAMGALQGMNAKLAETQAQYDEMKAGRDAIIDARDGMSQGKGEMENAAAEMNSSMAEMEDALLEMKKGEADLAEARASLADTIAKLTVVEKAIPNAFEEAQSNYLKAIDEKASEIQAVYQSTLNTGFSGMFMLVAAVSAIGALLTAMFRDDRPAPAEGSTGGHGHGGHGHGGRGHGGHGHGGHGHGHGRGRSKKVAGGDADTADAGTSTDTGTSTSTEVLPTPTQLPAE